MTFDFSKLQETEHMLKAFSDKPEEAILKNVGSMLNQQVAGSVIQEFAVTSDPYWLTAGKPSDGNDVLQISRLGCAFELAMKVQTGEEQHKLHGVYTWVSIDVDDVAQTKQKTWLDLDKFINSMDVESTLKTRLYYSK